MPKYNRKIDKISDAEFLEFFANNFDCNILKTISMITNDNKDGQKERMVMFEKQDKTLFCATLSDFGIWPNDRNVITFPKILQEKYRDYVNNYDNVKTQKDYVNYFFKHFSNYFK